ncbi:hypothetical protein ACHAXR_007700, partial [Thalassiosira sp. AJA248-18]
MMRSAVKMKCESCGAEGSNKFFECGGCLAAYFCSVSCQKKSWKSHKKTCRARRKACVKIQSTWRGWNTRSTVSDNLEGGDRCEVCGVPESNSKRHRLCDGCKISLFCSRTCQKAGWSEHKKTCRERKRAAFTILSAWKARRKSFSEKGEGNDKGNGKGNGKGKRKGKGKRQPRRSKNKHHQVKTTRTVEVESKRAKSVFFSSIALKKSCVAVAISVLVFVLIIMAQLSPTKRRTTNAKVLEFVTELRNTVENRPPSAWVNESVRIEMIPIFIGVLTYPKSPIVFGSIEYRIQLEAAYLLADISSEKTQAKWLVDAGAVTPLVQILSSSHANVREQSALCLGNIAATSSEYRYTILAAGALKPLLRCITTESDSHLLKCMKTIRNLSNVMPKQLTSELVDQWVYDAVPVLAGAILSVHFNVE